MSAAPVRLGSSMAPSEGVRRSGGWIGRIRGFDILGRLVFEETPTTFSFHKYRHPGKSVFQLLGRPLMTFPQWRMCQALDPHPVARSQVEYESYARYVENHKLANSRAPVATVKVPKQSEP